MIEPPLAPPWEGGETDALPPNATALPTLPQGNGCTPPQCNSAAHPPPRETDALPPNVTAPPTPPPGNGCTPPQCHSTAPPPPV